MEPDSGAQGHGEQTAEERRRYFRLNKVMPAHFTLLGDPPASAPEADEGLPKQRLFVVDISAGGFRATTHVPMTVDSRLKTEIFLDRKSPVTAECRVVWQRELSIPDMYEVGFEFTSIDQPEWKRLVDFIVDERSRSSRPQPVTWQVEKGYLNRPIGGY